MEALRWIEFLKQGGKMVINDLEIPSVPIQQGKVPYPEKILEELSKKADTTIFKASAIAEELGNPKTMNVVLLGALVRAMNMPNIDWEAVIRANVKPAFVEMNLEAFRAGQAQV